MRVTIRPGARISGKATIPGDKSIAHRLLILAATADGSSSIRGLPLGLDVRATASVLAALAPSAALGFERWLSTARDEVEGASPAGPSDTADLRLEGDGWGGLKPAPGPLDCANSGTTLRLMSGVLSGRPFRSELSGDASLRRRPMERVAEPLRAMGADVTTTDGGAPVAIRGGPLHGVEWDTAVPSAQVKGAILLAGLVAEGTTVVREPAATRDHTERMLGALGAPIQRVDRGVVLRAFQHRGFDASVCGDVSSAAFVIAAAAVTGGDVTIDDVGTNPSRTAALDVAGRLGIRISMDATGASLDEPFGRIAVRPGGELTGTSVGAGELPFVIDEVPALAAIAAHAGGPTRFEGAAELRVKESDRLTGIAEGLSELGGDARVEGDALVVAGGGLEGGTTSSRGDHRLAMAFSVAALGARGPSVIEDVETAAVSFPGFFRALRELGADLEVEP